MLKKIIGISIIFIFLLIFLNFVFGYVKVFGGGMLPLIKPDSIVIYTKPVFSSLQPLDGMIVYYHPNNELSGSIGRVISGPKTSIRVENGAIYQKNPTGMYKMDEKYLGRPIVRAYQEGKWYDIKPNYYFILSDQRSTLINIDYQVVPTENIMGIVFTSL